MFDVSGITDEQFWLEAEARAIEALRDYAKRATNGKGLTRRLFADDAAARICVRGHLPGAVRCCVDESAVWHSSYQGI
jgi:hypothetical protein